MSESGRKAETTRNVCSSRLTEITIAHADLLQCFVVKEHIFEDFLTFNQAREVITIDDDVLDSVIFAKLADERVGAFEVKSTVCNI